MFKSIPRPHVNIYENKHGKCPNFSDIFYTPSVEANNEKIYESLHMAFHVAIMAARSTAEASVPFRATAGICMQPQLTPCYRDRNEAEIS